MVRIVNENEINNDIFIKEIMAAYRQLEYLRKNAHKATKLIRTDAAQKMVNIIEKTP